MKSWKLFLSAALVALPAAIAQESSLSSAVSKLPKCAISCLGEAISKTECSATNQTCICTDQTLQQLVTTCIMGRCTIKEALLAKNLTATTCNEPIRDRSREYVAISNAFGIISALFVAQRFGYKIWAKLPFGPDDFLTLTAIVSGIPSTVFNAHGVAPNGMGRDAWTLTYDNITSFGRYFYILEVIYFAEVALLKLALLFFYVRIFPSAGVRHLLWGTIIFVSMFGVAFVFAAIFQCTPISYYWVKWDGEHQGKCLDINAIGWSNAAISIAVDGWMLAIPLWQLKGLKMDWRKKIGVAMMFCVGTFVTIVSVLRLQSLVKFGSDTPNPTWDFFDVGMWSTVEINVGIICVCLPSLRLLLVRLFPRLLGTTQRYYARYAGTSGANRSAATGQSRPCRGTGTTSHVERSQHRPEIQSNQITYQKTYAVEYGDKDNDEVHLVQLPDMDMKSTSALSTSARSEGS